MREAVRKEECCRLPFVTHLLSFGLAGKFSKNPGIRDGLFIMPRVTLSTGVTLQSEHVQRAAYYPCGSLRSDALIYAMSAGRNGALETHEENFLYINAISGAVHVRGNDAAQDATALEEAGVRVYRCPMAAAPSDS
jgi:hypothetical protein